MKASNNVRTEKAGYKVASSLCFTGESCDLKPLKRCRHQNGQPVIFVPPCNNGLPNRRLYL